jgi:SpoVK/Ycf46/Vps4 family AAA+-type ATPase
LPDEEERREIFDIYLKDAQFTEKTTRGEIIDKLAPLTDGCSGADIQALCQEAKFSAARTTRFEKFVPLTIEYFEEALNIIKQSSIPTANPVGFSR